ncbi:integrase arm-type DNA-binding domain-containing protein [Acidiphilium sp. AL]|uniref:Integrase arm-type DNA-binding domain-containing protein n=1 Tax=Acidiphilium iwatense TaxID=768198 RepID=A0ABS9E1J8_9PROT|nr:MULTISPECIES: site-specific integrase [Acidiphilium]MCF3947801.1 integrase arm-type DNA-binding domain-containing protein [Acidiphilium iwatense]MCU4161586.1 integrase arm-type DNA-binding domain-containing protein [Acidiphilium sp. AL]
MPKIVENKLTALAVRRITANGFYIDGRGLYLRIEDGRRLWVFRFTMPGSGKPAWFVIGQERDISLAQAREMARELRLKVRAGIDPRLERQAAKAARKAEADRTFEAVAEKYIAAHAAGWRNAKHAAQWAATLAAYAYPAIGGKPVASITTGDVLDLLDGLWTEKPETASRVRGRIESVLDYAKAQGWRSGENPAAWKGNLDHLLPARAKVARVQHHAAVPYAELPAVLAKLAEAQSMSALALQFVILTAARSGEARGARWNEIDLDARTWTIPGERMKAGRPHRVPLSNAVLAVLRAVAPLQRAPDAFIFPGGRIGSPLSDVSLSNALKAAGGGSATVHGCRSSFRDWCAEQTSYASEIAEAALAHVNRDKVEAAYQRSDLIERRARLMQDWADYLARPADSAVTPIRKARA